MNGSSDGIMRIYTEPSTKTKGVDDEVHKHSEQQDTPRQNGSR